MKTIIYPKKQDWSTILTRPLKDNDDLEQICKTIFEEVKRDGDTALFKYTWYFDKVKSVNMIVSEEEMGEAHKQINADLRKAIYMAKENIENFHKLQYPRKLEYNNDKGFSCWQEARAIEKVGLYIPGGSAPLFSTVLMLAIPAKIAGCKEIVICTPPQKDGKINPVILWTASICGVTKIFKVGGIQAIAGMTFGTATIPTVNKIFGPGNQFVTAAKQLATRNGVAIDMPAGPSELMIVADSGANPSFIASDLLSQAEHGVDSQVILLTTDEKLPDLVEKELSTQLKKLNRQEIAMASLINSKYIILKDKNQCLEMLNLYAPEHLMLCVENYMDWISDIENAGSVFLGDYSPESAGDYASGTNHTLPTNGFAKSYSGVNIDSFMKKITFQEITKKGLQYLGKSIQLMAENECLDAHKNAVSIRLNENDML